MWSWKQYQTSQTEISENLRERLIEQISIKLVVFSGTRDFWKTESTFDWVDFNEVGGT